MNLHRKCRLNLVRGSTEGSLNRKAILLDDISEEPEALHGDLIKMGGLRPLLVFLFVSEKGF